MREHTDKAILVVSFGTSHHDTRALTIDAIERDIQAAFGEYRIYRAWTSKMILAKLLKRDGEKIPNVAGSHGTDAKGRHCPCDCTAHPCD